MVTCKSCSPRLILLVGVASACGPTPSFPGTTAVDAATETGSPDAGGGLGADAAGPAEEETVVHVSPAGSDDSGTGGAEAPFATVQHALAVSSAGDVISIAAGVYFGSEASAHDPTCGNYQPEDFASGADITVGFEIAKSVTLRGVDREGVVLNTGSGYGVYVNCPAASDCQVTVENLTITGGVRDADGQASSAAIVARYADVDVVDVDIIANNLGGDLPGVAGIAGREGASLEVRGCRILDNSWDGIVLYQGAASTLGTGDSTRPYALVEGNIIGRATGNAGGGLGITWNGEMEARSNEIFEYPKGVVLIGDAARLTLEDNVVRDAVAYGIWAATGTAVEVRHNLFLDNGNAGFITSRSSPTMVVERNLFVGNGWWTHEQYAKRSGMYLYGAPAAYPSLVTNYNGFWDNPQSACHGGEMNGAACVALGVVGQSGNVEADPDLGADRRAQNPAMTDMGITSAFEVPPLP